MSDIVTCVSKPSSSLHAPDSSPSHKELNRSELENASRSQSEQMPSRASPYKGLMPYDERDAQFFSDDLPVRGKG